MRRLHLVTGVLAVLGFLVSGAHLRWGVDAAVVTETHHMVFVSRHIYMLGPGLLHLVLAAWLRPLDSPVRRLQWAGTLLLVLTSILLAAAFVHEAMAGHGRGIVSALGLYAFWAGAFLLALAPEVDRWWLGRRAS